MVGEQVHGFWSLAHENVQDALANSKEQVTAVGLAIARGIARTATGILAFALSIIIAGVLLAKADVVSRFVEALAVRLAPTGGKRFCRLAEQTVRGVASGVVGVALLQAVLAGVGFFAVGVPGAGILAVICLLVAIIQLPLAIPIVPVIIYVWAYEPTAAALLFTVWCVPVMLVDNVLKPILMGRGVEAPMLVVFVGSLGGMAASGIIGLFTGAVVLVVAYELCREWVGTAEARCLES